MADILSREIRLKKRPMGMTTPDDFEMTEVKIPEIVKGQILVRNA